MFPALDEVVRKIGISKYMIRRDFGPYVKALAACGLERHGCGYKIDMDKLFLDWAEVTRKLGKTPSMLDIRDARKIHDQGPGAELRRAGHTCRQVCWGMPERHNWKTTGRM